MASFALHGTSRTMPGRDVLRLLSFAIFLANEAMGAFLVFLYWTGRIGIQLYWVGVGMFFAGIVAMLMAHNSAERRSADRDMRRGFEVLPHDDDE